jgi:hypothetical protein
MTKVAPAAVQDVFLSAADLKGLIEKQQQAKAATEKKRTEEAQAAKRAILEELEKPVQITEQQVANAVSKFRDAAAAGQNEMVVFSFPSQLCTDRGRMINNALEGWQETLVGKPRSIYEAWQRYLKDGGYRFHARVLNYVEGMPGDIGLVIVWGTSNAHEQ